MSGTKNDSDQVRLELIPAELFRIAPRGAPDVNDDADPLADLAAWGQCDPEIPIERVFWDLCVLVSINGFHWSEALGTVLTFGAKKYAPWNWAKGLEWTRLVGAGLRHLTQVGYKDDESELPHAWHALACVAFLVVHERRGLGTDDRYRWPTIVPTIDASALYTQFFPEVCASDFGGKCNCYFCRSERSNG